MFTPRFTSEFLTVKRRRNEKNPDKKSFLSLLGPCRGHQLAAFQRTQNHMPLYAVFVNETSRQRKR